MVECRWIKMCLFVILLLHFTAAVTGQNPPTLYVRDGDDVTLPCENVINDQDKCDNTSWIFSKSPSTEAVELVSFGQIDKNSKDKSDRLSLTENCSLVIRRTSFRDPGVYLCRQSKSGQQQAPDSRVLLNLIRISASHFGNTETIHCSVSTYDQCRHYVRWLYNGGDVDELIPNTTESQRLCYASVEFQTSFTEYIKTFDSFTCEVFGNQVQRYPFLRPPPGWKPETTTTTTESSTTKPTRTSENSMNEGTITTATAFNDTSTEQQDCSVVTFIMLVLRVAELLLVTVITVLLFRARGRQRPANDNTVFHGGDGHDVTVNYENVGDPSASVKLNNTNIN